MAGELPGHMRIGEVLRGARERSGLTLRDAESDTKIRVRYLEALEDERWDDLPSAAYAKGFLRTYADLLGLDGERLVDEFRRQVEGGGGEQGAPVSERVLGRRGRPGGPPRRELPVPLLAIATIALVIGGLVAVGALTGGDEDEPTPTRSGGGAGESRESGTKPASGPVRLSIRVREPVEVCLVGGGGEALIDRQVMAAGTRDEFTRRRFELRFPAGVRPQQLRLELNGRERSPERSRGPAAYAIVAPDRLDPVEPPAKESCP